MGSATRSAAYCCGSANSALADPSIPQKNPASESGNNCSAPRALQTFSLSEIHPLALNAYSRPYKSIGHAASNAPAPFGTPPRPSMQTAP